MQLLGRAIQAEQTSCAKALRSGSHTFAHRTSVPVCLKQSALEEEEQETCGMWGFFLWALEITVAEERGEVHCGWKARVKGQARSERTGSRESRLRPHWKGPG